jgi:hypothetical protein
MWIEAARWPRIESGRWHLLEVGVVYPLTPGWAAAGFSHPEIEIQHSAALVAGLLLRGV